MYYIVFFICFLISLLPLRMLYWISYGLYLLLYYMIGYRKKIVFNNLRQAFPAKSEAEITFIAKKFFLNLTDLIVEIIKMFSISPSALAKRVTFDPGILLDLARKGRSCQIHLGHHFNWEWANLYLKLAMEKQPLLITYMPLSNKMSNRLFKHVRSRFGSILIPATDVLRAMQPWKEKTYISVLVADQNPGKVRRAYWTPFLNKKTAFYKGPELSARRGDIAVVFGGIQKVKRGHYHFTVQLAFDHPDAEDEGAVTSAFARFLENEICRQPENWLWSHRRWKHEWKGGSDNR